MAIIDNNALVPDPNVSKNVIPTTGLPLSTATVSTTPPPPVTPPPAPTTTSTSTTPATPTTTTTPPPQTPVVATTPTTTPVPLTFDQKMAAGWRYNTQGLLVSPTDPSLVAPTVNNDTNGVNQARQNGGTYTGQDGKQYYNYDGTPAQSTTSSTTPTPTTGNTSTDAATKEMLQNSANLQAAATDVQTTIHNIQYGITPLTPGEQAQIDGLKQQFQVLIDQQILTNKGATGIAQLRGYQHGAGEYDPTFQVKTIGAIISAGAAKVADLQIKEAAAVAQLTQSFHDNDIKAVKDAWDIYQTAYKDRQDALQKTVEAANAAIKAAQDKVAADRNYQLDVDKFAQTKDQNAFDNALKTEQQKFEETYKTKSLAIDAFKAGYGAGGGNGVGNGITQASVTGSGAPDPVSQKQTLDQIAKQYGPMTAIAIKGLADYSINPMDWSSRAGGKGMTREQAVTLAKMVDPSYNDSMYNVRAAYMKSLASTGANSAGSAINAANKSINHLTAFVTDMDKSGNNTSSTINWAYNSTVGNLDSNHRRVLAAAKVEGLGVAEELAKFFKGSGTTDVASIEAWKSNINVDASPADMKGLTQGAITLLAGQLEVLAEQYASTMGKPPETDFLSPSARQSLGKLKDAGYEVNIPGVYYTNKSAWQQNGGTQDEWNSAVDTLTKAGLPLTEENILQFAQEQ